MTRALLIALLLAACAPAQPHLGVRATPAGVAVTPSVATTMGGVRIGASPHGAHLGTRIGGVGLGIRL